MSAYVVERDHIRYMVEAAVSGTYHSGGLRWVTGSRVEGTAQCHTLDQGDLEHAARIGQMLWDENVKSVCYRYDEPADSTDLPGPVGETYTYEVHPLTSSTVDPLAVFQVLSCYEYQTCEHPGWNDSEAYTIVQAIKDKMIRRISDDAPGWGDVPKLQPFTGISLSSLIR